MLLTIEAELLKRQIDVTFTYNSIIWMTGDSLPILLNWLESNLCFFFGKNVLNFTTKLQNLKVAIFACDRKVKRVPISSGHLRVNA